MSKISLQEGGGLGSSISLAPETIKVRNALIEKFTNEPVEEMNNFMNKALATEKDELRRIGILAARIFLLRARIANLKDFNRDDTLTSISEINIDALNLDDPNAASAHDDDEKANTIEDNWTRLQMTSSGEVQGVKFLSGAIIDAKPDDAEKLISSGNAVRIDGDGNIIEHQEDNFDNHENSGSAESPENRTKNNSDSAEFDDNTLNEPIDHTLSNVEAKSTAETVSNEKLSLADQDDKS